MNAVIITLGARGDVEPYLALAAGLRTSGHHAVIATHANFEAAVQAAGLGFVPIAEDIETLMSSDRARAVMQDPLRLLRGMRRRAEEVLQGVIAACDEACDGAEVIVSSLLGQFAGRAVAA